MQRTEARASKQHRLPHQIQRIIRATTNTGMQGLVAEAVAALERLRGLLGQRTA